MKSITLSWSNNIAIRKVIEALRKNKVCLGDSDTVPGFFVKASYQALSELDTLKNRSNKPYLVLVRSCHDACKLIKIKDHHFFTVLQHYWPGPLTVIGQAQKSVASYLQNAHGAIAVRVPDHKGLQSVLAHIPHLFSTSANLHGHAVPHTVKEVNNELKKRVAYSIIDDVRKQDAKQKVPSTLIDITGDKPIVCRGGILLEKIISKVKKDHCYQ